MRDIRFRAWSELNKEMYLNYCICRKDGVFETSSPCITGDLIIMQFTGLRDKNGKEIYEGDVLAMNNGQYNSRVSWDDSLTGWKAEHKSSGCESITAFIEEHEIIGNIWENPELLKEPTQ